MATTTRSRPRTTAKGTDAKRTPMKRPMKSRPTRDESAVIERAQELIEEGKPATTAAGEFVVEEKRKLARGESNAKFPKQAVAIGLSKARRAGIPLPPPPEGVSERTRRTAERDEAMGREHRIEAPSKATPRRSETSPGRIRKTTSKRSSGRKP